MVLVRAVRCEVSLQEIKTASEGGYLLSIMNIGDTIILPHDDYGDIEFVLADYKDRTAYFVSRRVVFEDNMNTRDTNSGWFPQSEIATTLNGFGKGFGEDVTSLIKPRHIRQEFGGEVFECDSLFWLPSAVEVHGEEMMEYDVEEGVSQFPLFMDELNWARAGAWWLRSPHASHFAGFVSVIGNGTLAFYDASYTFGIVPCFLL